MACNASSDSSSTISFRQEESVMANFQFCVVGESLKSNVMLKEALETHQVPILYSETGYEYMRNDTDRTTIFVLQEFEGEVYESLHRSGQRIFGPTALIQLAIRHEPLPNNVRPLYTTSMRNIVVCFTGFRIKEELSRMALLIHHMGGSVRKDFVTKITHLVANCTSGEKYKYAAGLSMPIMKMEWVEALWSQRHETHSSAADETTSQFKLSPFFGCKLVFIGFKEDEKKHVEEVTVDNGGEVVLPNDSSCTHIIVEDGYSPSAESLPQNFSEVSTVKTEWFWASIQMEARAEENLYKFEQPSTSSSGVPFTLTPAMRGNKRKRLESVAHQLAMGSAQDTDFCSTPHDHKRKTSDVAKLSISGSFLDATLSPEKSYLDSPADNGYCDTTIKITTDVRNQSARQQVCTELFQTETNYVGILYTILSVFKEPLENPEICGGPLIAAAEVKIIFGNLPPIYEVHQKIRSELSELIHCWKEDCNIGSLILKHSQDIMKAYPPFTNFLEKSKQVLQRCDATKPRFHAFLKRCQSKPECGRQSLQELLIRPVQRLPSVILLLNEILKYTNKEAADYVVLEKAIASLKEALTHMNEDKRRTEGQVAMFDIVNDIDNCPPDLLSSHRNFVTRADMQEAGRDALSRRGDTISMFLFTDVLEICKMRSKAVASLKSPGVVSLSSGASRVQQKSFKHLMWIRLSHIKTVVDVLDTEESKNAFAIVVRSNQELKERLYSFILLSEEVNKATFLKTLCRHVANAVCRTDVENLLISLEPQHLALDTNSASGNAIAKAFKIATKTRDKLGRALSMRRTPTKRGLSRAVSTIISPLRSLGSPSSTLQGSRMASVSNLSLLDAVSSGMPSPITGKKPKSSSVGVTSSKYL